MIAVGIHRTRPRTPIATSLAVSIVGFEKEGIATSRV